MKRLKQLVCLLPLLILMGCESEEELLECHTVSGRVVNCTVTREDSNHAYVLIEFEDKFVKLRSKYSQSFQIPKGKEVTIYFGNTQKIKRIQVGIEENE